METASHYKPRSGTHTSHGTLSEGSRSDKDSLVASFLTQSQESQRTETGIPTEQASTGHQTRPNLKEKSTHYMADDQASDSASQDDEVTLSGDPDSIERKHKFVIEKTQEDTIISPDMMKQSNGLYNSGLNSLLSDRNNNFAAQQRELKASNNGIPPNFYDSVFTDKTFSDINQFASLDDSEIGGENIGSSIIAGTNLLTSASPYILPPAEPRIKRNSSEMLQGSPAVTTNMVPDMQSLPNVISIIGSGLPPVTPATVLSPILPPFTYSHPSPPLKKKKLHEEPVSSFSTTTATATGEAASAGNGVNLSPLGNYNYRSREKSNLSQSNRGFFSTLPSPEDQKRVRCTWTADENRKLLQILGDASQPVPDVAVIRDQLIAMDPGNTKTLDHVRNKRANLIQKANARGITIGDVLREDISKMEQGIYDYEGSDRKHYGGDLKKHKIKKPGRPRNRSIPSTRSSTSSTASKNPSITSPTNQSVFSNAQITQMKPIMTMGTSQVGPPPTTATLQSTSEPNSSSSYTTSMMESEPSQPMSELENYLLQELQEVKRQVAVLRYELAVFRGVRPTDDVVQNLEFGYSTNETDESSISDQWN